MLRVATDCSGIEAPIVALQNMKIKFSHEWSSETDKDCRKMILANFKPKILFEDIAKRSTKDLPDIDLYVCGFPCQSFSSLRPIYLGDKTKRDARKNLFKHCVQVIEKKKPKAFVLENVPSLVKSNNGAQFKALLKALEQIGKYDIHAQVLNTIDYGIPQNRQRLYVVGIRQDVHKVPFRFPQPRQTFPPLSSFLLDKTKHRFDPKKYSQRLQERIPEDHNKKVYAIKWRAGEGIGIEFTPCITTSTDIFITRFNRNLTPREKFVLQGFPLKMKIVVSDAVLAKQAGNAMSVNVLEALFTEIFRSWNAHK